MEIDFSPLGDAIGQLEKSISFATAELAEEVNTMPSIDLSPENWCEVCEILQNHARNYSVWAFGSRVKGNAKKYSDLDLVIVTQKPLSISQMAQLTEAFDESNLPICVDIVDWASTNKAFQEIIEQQKVVIQEGQNDAILH